MRSLSVTANGFKKLFDAPVTLFFAERRVRDMLSCVILDDLFHQPVDGTPSGRNKMECLGAVEIRFQCSFNSLNLSGNTFYAFKKIVFV